MLLILVNILPIQFTARPKNNDEYENHAKELLQLHLACMYCISADYHNDA